MKAKGEKSFLFQNFWSRQHNSKCFFTSEFLLRNEHLRWPRKIIRVHQHNSKCFFTSEVLLREERLDLPCRHISCHWYSKTLEISIFYVFILKLKSKLGMLLLFCSIFVRQWKAKKLTDLMRTFMHPDVHSLLRLCFIQDRLTSWSNKHLKGTRLFFWKIIFVLLKDLYVVLLKDLYVVLLNDFLFF